MPLRNATLEVVQQVIDLIGVSKTIYSKSHAASMSPIGTHMRHIIDHFWAFQEGVKTGCIDYNSRHRDTVLEQDSDLALKASHRFIEWLTEIDLDNKPLTVISEISVSQSESTLMKSNVNRELAYLINHTLHHIAYAKLLAKIQGISVPDHLGVAPATASYLRDQKASMCAR